MSLVKILLAATILAVLIGIGIASFKPGLSGVHKAIKTNFASVEHIDAKSLLGFEKPQYLIFDVRKREEFSVSHLEGAIHVDPEISKEEFKALYADKLKGKTAIFYCSVGWRSSKLADRVKQVLNEAGVIASYNLTGGIFKWHNEKLPLSGLNNEPTEAIHPYNNKWSRYINDKSTIRYEKGSL